MTAWDTATVARISEATELDLASQRPDGTLSTRTTMWVVGLDGDLYVRSAYGSDSTWYRRALKARAGHIWAGGADTAVRLEPVDPTDEVHKNIDTAYHHKYDQYGPRIVGSVVGDRAAEVTIRLVPSTDSSDDASL